MTDQIKSDNSLAAPQAETDVVVLLKKINQKLDFLERKIDALASQSQERPFREKSFSQPSQSFERPYRPNRPHDRRGYGEGSRERKFHSGHHFEKRHGGESRGFDSFRREPREDRESHSGPSHSGPSHSGPSHSFKKSYGGKKTGFDSKKKFFYKPKDNVR